MRSPVLKGPNYEEIKTHEIRAIYDLMNHIAEVDVNRRTAGFQVMNEPYWHEMSQPFWMENWNKNNDGEDRWVYDWISDVAVAIKASDYNLVTRINGTLFAYNAEQYTWLNKMPGIDCVGDDSYRSDVNTITDIITNRLAGSKFPHIAENSGDFSNTSSLVLTTLVNGGGYQGWQLNGNYQAMSYEPFESWKVGTPGVWVESGRDMKRFESCH